MTTPRLITHRPDLLRLDRWSWSGPDADVRLAAWLDVSHTIGADWLDPDLVLIDVQCLDLLEVLYGPRRRFTVAVGTGSADTGTMLTAQDDARLDVGIRLDHPSGLSAVRAILARYATGVRPPIPHRTPARPRLQLVPEVGA